MSGQKLCGAKTKNGPCRSFAMANGRCRVHGGASLCGPASGSWKHGRHSIYASKLRPEEQDDYFAALSAPDPLDLAEELAMTRYLLRQALCPGPDLYGVRRMLHDASNALERALRGEESASGPTLEEMLAPESEADDWDDKPTVERGVWQDVERAQELVSAAYDLLTGQETRPTDHKLVKQYTDAVTRLAATSAQVLDMKANSLSRIQATAVLQRISTLIAENVHDVADRRRLITALQQMVLELAPSRPAPMVEAKKSGEV